MRDYGDNHFGTQEQREYYKSMDKSPRKKLGDKTELKILELLKNKGYNVRISSPEEDSLKHADLVLADGSTIDIKCKKHFTLELINQWGHEGWLFTGADIIVQCFHDSEYWGDDIYYYDRADMVKYYNEHRWIFGDKYCKFKDKAKLWDLGKKRLAEMNFVHKLN